MWIQTNAMMVVSIVPYPSLHTHSSHIADFLSVAMKFSPYSTMCTLHIACTWTYKSTSAVYVYTCSLCTCTVYMENVCSMLAQEQKGNSERRKNS